MCLHARSSAAAVVWRLHWQCAPCWRRTECLRVLTQPRRSSLLNQPAPHGCCAAAVCHRLQPLLEPHTRLPAAPAAHIITKPATAAPASRTPAIHDHAGACWCTQALKRAHIKHMTGAARAAERPPSCKAPSPASQPKMGQCAPTVVHAHGSGNGAQGNAHQPTCHNQGGW